jgi:hypothetical protein
VSNITYNEKEEAYELPYKLWGEVMTVRFYVDSEQTIMEHLKDIAGKLEKLNGSKKAIAQLIIDEGFYDYFEPAELAENMTLANVYVDVDEDDIVVCFCVGTKDGFAPGSDMISVELFGGDFEVVGKV